MPLFEQGRRGETRLPARGTGEYLTKSILMGPALLRTRVWVGRSFIFRDGFGSLHGKPVERAHKQDPRSNIKHSGQTHRAPSPYDRTMSIKR
jgi:hypothetical protein